MRAVETGLPLGVRHRDSTTVHPAHPALPGNELHLPSKDNDLYASDWSWGTSQALACRSCGTRCPGLQKIRKVTPQAVGSLSWFHNIQGHRRETRAGSNTRMEGSHLHDDVPAAFTSQRYIRETTRRCFLQRLPGKSLHAGQRGIHRLQRSVQLETGPAAVTHPHFAVTGQGDQGYVMACRRQQIRENIPGARSEHAGLPHCFESATLVVSAEVYMKNPHAMVGTC